jgi:ABC-type bacteriocin/lantibiotic exporter with double-glycine peptidase domain
MPTAGQVLYDGRDLRELEVVSVRRRLGMVPQSAYLFGTSIRENIALAAPGASLDQIEEAARVAAIHEDIAAMPLGYETVLADGGASLSGGQRQRIALARALLADAPVLVLDEPAAHLDEETARQVIDDAMDAAADRAVLLITHRGEGVARCHEVVELG